jgi:alginate O-acetyltransferase complex protein AlgI
LIFTSQEFLIFYAVVISAYFALEFTPLRRHEVEATRVRSVNILIALSSFIFYGWNSFQFVGILIFSGLVDFAAGMALEKPRHQAAKKLILGVSIVINLGLLFYFKYFSFALDTVASIADLLGHNRAFSDESFSIFKNVILPAGISFYTFQSMSYTIDVYRQEIKPTRDIFKFFAYLTYFPQLIAGPIERASSLLPQFSRLHGFNEALATEGAYQVLWGFFKKLVIADSIGRLVDLSYSTQITSAWQSLICGVGFGIQIYCDFSGYSDIAIGSAMIMGYRLTTNFNSPYTKTNIRSFWRNWNISLSNWFKSYIYFPLTKRIAARGVREDVSQASGVLAVFSISGAWHGAGWGFIAWGLINGISYLISLIPFPCLNSKVDECNESRFIRHALGWLATITVVCISWVFFRSSSFQQSLSILGSLFSEPWTVASIDPAIKSMARQNIFQLLIFVPLLFGIEFMMGERSQPFKLIGATPLRYSAAIAMAFTIAIFGYSGDPMFIYFQF